MMREHRLKNVPGGPELHLAINVAIFIVGAAIFLYCLATMGRAPL